MKPSVIYWLICCVRKFDRGHTGTKTVRLRRRLFIYGFAVASNGRYFAIYLVVEKDVIYSIYWVIHIASSHTISILYGLKVVFSSAKRWFLRFLSVVEDVEIASHFGSPIDEKVGLKQDM